jgi:hypothetical protein
MVANNRQLWLHLLFAMISEGLFMLLVLPWCVKDFPYEWQVWQDFLVASGAVLVLYLLWLVLSQGTSWQRLWAAILCFLPGWLLGYVILQHFEAVPRWFS